MSNPKKILIIHGFNSSPQSMKAVLTKTFIGKNYPAIEVICPQLISNPAAAIAQLCQIIDAEPNTEWYLIGSSLGGFYATYLAEKYNILAVLINPAVTPYTLLQEYIGEQVNPHSGEIYQVTKQHMQQLISIDAKISQQKMFFVMVQTGDEVLDYQQAVEKYQHCRLTVQQGGDHSFINFANMLPEIVDFFQL